jgi:uncharacterized protein YrrD
MQNTTTTVRKWSDLKGLAAVAIDSGKKEGTIDDFYFDPQTNRVQAFLIKTGLFSHHVLMSSTITAVGIDALTFADASLLIKAESNPELAALPFGSVLLSYRVLSEGGDLVGTIGNIYMNTTLPTQLSVSAFELAGGLREHISGQYPNFSSSHVLRYGQDVIVIPDDIARKLK